MRILPAGLQAHLESGATTLCWCWLLQTPAETLGFTDHDDDVVFGGVAYEADAGFTGSEMEARAGLAADNLEVAGALRSDRLTAEKLQAGAYDNATVEIWLVNWQDTAQRLLLRKGTLGEARHGGVGFTAEIRGLAQALDQPRGRMFGKACDAVLGDGRCGFNLIAAAGVVASAEDGRRVTATGLGSFAAEWFTRGEVTFTSGANIGRAMEVKAHGKAGTIVTLELWQPMAAAISPGDGFTVTPGCDKQFATCKAKFNNAANFRGFPHMPGNDFVSSYPNRGGDNTGSAIT
jgi:uncharacterized phage protein (TIGR02218 family)